MVTRIPLFGLLEDVVLPEETREVGAPALDPAHLDALRGRVGQRVAMITITSPVELPATVAGRFATEVDVLEERADGFVVRGAGRLKIVRATHTAPPYEAEVTDADLAPVSHAELVAAMLAVVDAFARGGEVEGGPARLHAAAAALVRAATPVDALAAASDDPLDVRLRALAEQIRARAPAFDAERRLEHHVRTLSPREALSPAQRRRLWSEVVEIEKALDVFEPTRDVEFDDLARLERTLRQAGLPPEGKEVARRTLRQLRLMDTRQHEYSNMRAHLDLIARLPWHSPDPPPPDIHHVSRVLDQTHEGLPKVKERVLEAVAVRMLGGAARATVLCLAGPPGTGKTTIAKAMAEALGRPFISVALGGMHDESELRGHRRSFTAAAPGRIIDAMARAGNRHALVLLDEIDKLGADRTRSPGGALIEILDPEQNTRFRDNYLEIRFDLSSVLFVCTANDLGRVDPILRDRLEVVELDGYGLEEKRRLARTHLLPRLLTETGLPTPISLSDDVLTGIIEGYTREAGLRQLRRCLESLCRARALAVVRQTPLDPEVTPAEVARVLGRASSPARRREPSLPPGTAYGLSVGAAGGALLAVEVLRLPGTGELHLTGQLGDVLKESARAALAHLRHHPARYGLTAAAFDAALHVHLPDGATPKDGPSAGVALAVAITSALTGRPVRADLAFTGEITLGGRVLPVGGVRAKVLAAERAGCVSVVIPSSNLGEAPEDAQLEVVAIDTLDDAMRVAFEPTPDAAAP